MRWTDRLGLYLGILALAWSGPAIAEERPDLAPCEDVERFGEGALCGRLAVAEDRWAEGGRRIDLRVVVLPAEQPAGREPVFLLAGGPGQAATDLAGLANGPFAEVRKVRDFVLVDQRGTGGSNRIDCPSDLLEDPQSAFGSIFDPAGIARCLEAASTHADVRLYSTLPVVADLDEVRAWLGYDRVLLWGGSGGTRTALVYLREFPDRVAGAVLAAVTGVGNLGPAGYARGSQQALERVFADCRAQEACRVAFPELEKDFRAVRALFEKGPVATAISREDNGEVPIRMHAGDFGYAVRGMLYSRQRIAALPAMIHRAAQDKDVSAFAQAYWLRAAAVLPSIAIGVHLAVFCTEDLPFVDPEELEALDRDTFLGSYTYDQYAGACAAWEAEPVPVAYREPVRSAAPVLLISGYYDPSTPPSMAEQAARGLTNSRHLVARDASHGAGFACGRQAAIDFLLRGTLEGLGPACEASTPIVFDTDP